MPSGDESTVLTMHDQEQWFRRRWAFVRLHDQEQWFRRRWAFVRLTQVGIA